MAPVPFQAWSATAANISFLSNVWEQRLIAEQIAASAPRRGCAGRGVEQDEVVEQNAAGIRLREASDGIHQSSCRRHPVRKNGDASGGLEFDVEGKTGGAELRRIIRSPAVLQFVRGENRPRTQGQAYQSAGQRGITVKTATAAVCVCPECCPRS